jgi:hypothetical protein
LGIGWFSKTAKQAAFLCSTFLRKLAEKRTSAFCLRAKRIAEACLALPVREKIQKYILTGNASIHLAVKIINNATISPLISTTKDDKFYFFIFILVIHQKNPSILHLHLYLCNATVRLKAENQSNKFTGLLL